MPDSPEVLDALRDVVASRGWTLVAADEEAGTYRAELSGTIKREASSSTAAGLVVAIDSHTQRQLASAVEWPSSMPFIIHGVVEEDDLK
jgi:hypothetical protein